MDAHYVKHVNKCKLVVRVLTVDETYTYRISYHQNYNVNI